MQQGQGLFNLLVVMMGVLGITSKLRWGPLLLFFFVVAGQFYQQENFPPQRGTGVAEASLLKIKDIALSTGVLGYIVCHYRMQAILLNAAPIDPRQRLGAPRRKFPWFRRRPPVAPDCRTPHRISPLEIAFLALSVPAWAFVGQGLFAVFTIQLNLFGIPVWVWQILMLSWVMILGFFLARLVFMVWDVKLHGPIAARLLLQGRYLATNSARTAPPFSLARLAQSWQAGKRRGKSGC